MKRLRSIQFELAVFLIDHHSGQWSRGYVCSPNFTRTISPHRSVLRCETPLHTRVWFQSLQTRFESHLEPNLNQSRTAGERGATHGQEAKT